MSAKPSKLKADEAAEAMSDLDSMFSDVPVEVTPSPFKAKGKRRQRVDDLIAIARTQGESPETRRRPARSRRSSKGDRFTAWHAFNIVVYLAGLWAIGSWVFRLVF